MLVCAWQARGADSGAGRSVPYASIGMASWYGGSAHSGRTSNGETISMASISAAHKSMPLPCYARVTNLRNGRSLVVRVNDRGPFTRGRMIDVSARAATLLGFRGQGVARVKVEYIGKAQPAGSDEKFLLASLRSGDGPDIEAPLSYTTAAAARPIDGPALMALVSAFRAANDGARAETPEPASPFGDLMRSPFLEVVARD